MVYKLYLTKIAFKKQYKERSFHVGQWFGCHTSATGGADSIPGEGTNTPHDAAWPKH